jgi:hypothetical protein
MKNMKIRSKTKKNNKKTNKSNQKKISKNTNKNKKTNKANRKTSRRKRMQMNGGVKRKERDECAICLDDLDDSNNPILTLSCQHTFHIGCLHRTCIATRGYCRCPLCRRYLTPEDLEQLGIEQHAQPEQNPLNLPDEPPRFTNIDDFIVYVNNELNESPTQEEALEEVELILETFLGTDNIPIDIFDVIMEFHLEQIEPLEGEEPSYKYRFSRVIQNIPDDRLGRKYFQYVDYITGNAGEDELNEFEGDDPAYFAFEIHEL